jgi:type II secretory pathway pseudopilin PulG
MKKPSLSQGVTVIELMVVAVILIILASLVALTASGVQANNRNKDRQADIDALRSQLETYYAGTDTYPTLENLDDKQWRSENLPKLEDGFINDPRWNKDIAECSSGGNALLASEPAPNCYGYQVTGSEGSACDNVKTPCVHYTLTATLEGGEQYVKSSLN